MKNLNIFFKIFKKIFDLIILDLWLARSMPRSGWGLGLDSSSGLRSGSRSGSRSRSRSKSGSSSRSKFGNWVWA